LINSLYELLLIIIECEISPLLFECCLYVGIVQITGVTADVVDSSSRHRSHALIRNGMRIFICFVFLVTYYFLSCCWTTFGFETYYVADVEALVSSFDLKRW